jgi:hypothetical protein
MRLTESYRTSAGSLLQPYCLIGSGNPVLETSSLLGNLVNSLWNAVPSFCSEPQTSTTTGEVS